MGHLQTNKADKAAGLFQAVHTVDSLRVAQALNKERLKRSLPPLLCLLEVNVAGEAQKFGLPPALAEAGELLRQCAELAGLKLAGLMCMAPYTERPEATSRPVFRRLRELLAEANAKGCYPTPLTELSMGMSQDYAIAIEEGATMVRVGTALFE
ncbi:MAG: YggS family pyridoxal phosphate-dependent enzyme [Planctomycetota bacterium]